VIDDYWRKADFPINGLRAEISSANGTPATAHFLEADF
jgi:hypothetical protein